MPRWIHSSALQISAPAQAARCVATIAKTAREPAASAEPPLKPNQPTHSRPVPTTASDRSNGARFSRPKPWRLPDHQRRDEAGDAGVDMHDGAAGEIEQTHLLQEAAAPHPMRRGHIDDEQPDAQNSMKAENFMRSATAPPTSAQVMTAKVI